MRRRIHPSFWRKMMNAVLTIRKRRTCGLFTVLLLCTGVEASSHARPKAQGETRVHLEGVLVEGGAECPRFRASDNTYYTLEGNLRGFRIGDTVEITGVLLNASHCMQDTPVRVDTINRAKRPASLPRGQPDERIAISATSAGALLAGRRSLPTGHR